MTRIGCVLALALAVLATPAAAQTIDTFPLWNSSNFINAWGSTSTPTYGQTFTPTVGQTSLTGMTFSINNQNLADTYRAHVYQFAGNVITGAAVFTSAPLNLPAQAGFQNVAISTGGVAVTPGLTYVAFFSALEGGAGGGSQWAYLGATAQNGFDGYAGGNFVFNNTGTFANLFSVVWDNPSAYGGQASHDTAFQLNFAAVPEPTTLALFGLVAAGSGGGWWWRRNKKTLEVQQTPRALG